MQVDWWTRCTTKTIHTQDDSYFNISSEKFTLTVVTSLIMISFTYLIWNEALCVRCVLCWLPAVKKGAAADWGAETPILSHLYRRRMIAPNIFKLKQHLLGPGELNVDILPHKSSVSLVLPPLRTNEIKRGSASEAWLVRYLFKVSISLSTLLHTFLCKVEYPINYCDMQQKLQQGSVLMDVNLPVPKTILR